MQDNNVSELNDSQFDAAIAQGVTLIKAINTLK
jgi:hypothetical protein